MLIELVLPVTEQGQARMYAEFASVPRVDEQVMLSTNSDDLNVISVAHWPSGEYKDDAGIDIAATVRLG